jgi:hypothetical protein
MIVFRLLLIGALIFTFAIEKSSAWSGAGHMVIAVEAFRELPAKNKMKVTEILKAHPEYERWQRSYEGDSKSLDLDVYVFMKASTWPDEIRRKGSEHDHPKWHYIDYPLRAPKFRFERAPSPDNDILFGLEHCEKTLESRKSLPVARAVALSWLIHLVGDIHQPLHCCSFFSAEYPEGDKGGNEFFISPADRAIRLHSFWDGLLGTRANMHNLMNDAIQLASEHPRRSLKELRSGKPKVWSREGRELALERAYLRGHLKGSRKAEAAPELPEGYTKAAKALAERQGALAGYRLADEIRKFVR